MADALVSSGLAAVGFNQGIDAGAWLHERDVNGNLQANPALFLSGMVNISSQLRARGVKLGPHRPRRRLMRPWWPGPGGHGHRTRPSSVGASHPEGRLLRGPCTTTPQQSWRPGREVGAALNATGVPIYLSICPEVQPPPRTGPADAIAGEGCTSQAPREQKRGVANAWLVEVRNNVDAWSPSSGSPCIPVRALQAT